jgi:hypothetical protein
MMLRNLSEEIKRSRERNPLSLPNVELVTIRGGGESSMYFLRVLKHCMGLVNFGQVTFFTNDDIPSGEGIKVVKIDSMGREGYSDFCIHELPSRTSLPFVMIVQADGFLTNPAAWTDKFFRYDYVGAPWAAEWQNADDRVGNGGFSLRSRKFLDVCARFPFPTKGCNEDHLLCRTYNGWMREQGVRFAPLNLAARFSREQILSEFSGDPNKVFGFHGWCAGREAYKFLIYGFDE